MRKALMTIAAIVCCTSISAQVKVDKETKNLLESMGMVFDKEPDNAAKAEIDGLVVYVPWVQLWDGGPKFATYNVGVTDGKIENRGKSYSWGYTDGKELDDRLQAGTGTFEYQYSGNENPDIDGTIVGYGDTAAFYWGKNWRTPTAAELMGLIDNCKAERATINGTEGMLFTGKGVYADKSVFFPSFSNVNNIPDYFSGAYWSSSRPVGNNAGAILFNDSEVRGVDTHYTNTLFVRPVLDK